jgi:ammonium transporter
VGQSQLDILWVLLCTFLVFIMQAGFLFLEAGLVRAKNYINVAVKNLVDISLAILFFWLFGFGIMFSGALPGVRVLLPDLTSLDQATIVFFMFQAAFAGTTVTIISGAIAERMRFPSYLWIVVSMAAAYPFVGRWIWGGGWLSDRGFVDFAGSTVVHGVGGAAALAAVLAVGPRHGIFNDDGEYVGVTPSNLPMSTFGVLVLWLGWFGFNGGSTLALSDDVPRIVLVTMIGGAAGMSASIAVDGFRVGYVVPTVPVNGVLGGLVGITAGAHVFSSLDAVVVGAIGGLVATAAELLLVRYRIDDAVGAVPVHMGAGIWGTIAVGIFGDQQLLGTGLSRLRQIFEQTFGVTVALVVAFAVTYGLLTLIKRFQPIRVEVHEERMGLNEAEHHVKSELSDVLGDIKSTTFGAVTQTSEKLAVSMEGLAERSDGLAAELADTSKSATAMEHSLHRSAAEAGSFVTDTEAAVTTLEAMLNNLGATAEATRAATGASTESSQMAADGGGQLRERIVAIAQNSESIEQVVNLIEGLAKKTNLLALNAAIEAERAGDAGRGFAVVATEVKMLADDTLGALDEIRDMVRQSKTDSMNTVDLAERVLDNIVQLSAATADSVSRAAEMTESESGRITELARSFQTMTTRSKEMAEILSTDAARARSVSTSVTAVNGLAAEMRESSSNIRADAQSAFAAIAEIDV